MIESFVILFILAVLCESIVEWVKELIPFEETVTRLIALVVGIVLAVGAGQNLFDLLAIDFAYPVVGFAIAGLVVSRGSNYIHDLLNRIRGE